VLEREVRKRNDEEGLGGQSRLAAEVAASGLMRLQTAERRLYSILTGHARRRDGSSYRQQWVSFETADTFLTALGLEHLWHSELARYLPKAQIPSRPSDEDFDATCALCKRWIDWSSATGGVRVLLRERGRRAAWWSLCYRCAAQELPQPLRASGRRARAPARRLSWEEARALYLLYVERQLPLSAVAAGVYRRYGFASAASCAGALERMLRELGLPLRSRAESRRLGARTRPPASGTRIPEQVLRQIHDLHWQHDVSLHEVAKRNYARFGYASAKSMVSAVSDAWKKMGLQARDRIEMTRAKSLKHGLSPRDWKERRRKRLEAGLTVAGKERRPRCRARKRQPPGKGRRCARPALIGSDYCQAHDPRLAAQRKAALEAMWARRPRRRLVRWSAVEALLRSQLAGERYLVVRVAALSGVPDHTVRTLWKGERETLTLELALRLLRPFAQERQLLALLGDEDEARAA
jgi:hypothetical protein